MKSGALRCYLCGSTTKFFLEKLGYRIYRCAKCGLAMTDFNEEYEKFIKSFYGKGYFTGDPQCGAFDQYRKDKKNIIRNNAAVLNRIRKYKPKGKLLDAGCAMGFFVEYAMKRGYDAYGFDPSEYAVTHAPKQLDGRLKVGSIASVSYPKNSFDVITMFDVFEHLSDPVESISKLRDLLTDDGVIVIATGDARSLAARLLRKRWTFYIPPQHLFFFTRTTMTKALEKAGYAPARWFRVGKWLSLGYILHLADVSSGVKLARAIHDLSKYFKLARMPLYVPLRDNMVVIARKK